MTSCFQIDLESDADKPNQVKNRKQNGFKARMAMASFFCFNFCINQGQKSGCLAVPDFVEYVTFIDWGYNCKVTALFCFFFNMEVFTVMLNISDNTILADILQGFLVEEDLD